MVCHASARPAARGARRTARTARGAARAGRALDVLGGLLGAVELLVRLVARALVVGLVETRPLEDDPGARAEEALERRLLALGAFGQKRRGDRLELVEVVPAVLALVLVGRHEPLR